MAARHGRGQPATPMDILHLPRRSRGQKPDCRRNLRDLLDQERSDLASMEMAAARTPASDVGVAISGCEESCQTQAEILHAESDFLRMDLESSTGKLEPERAARKDVSMRSNEDSLVPGRKKIDVRAGDRGDLGGGIDDLEEKMQELKLRRSRSKGISMKLSRRRYFHRQSSVLRRDMVLIKEDAEILKDIKETSLLNLALLGKKRPDVEGEKMEMLKRKMEGLSRGMLERLEECSHLLASKSTSSQDIVSYNEAEHMPFIQLRQQLRQEKSIEKQKEFRCCSCMEAVGRIMQQVWAESEQWSEMQQMLEQVKIEMEELRSSRDHWQRQAVASEINFHILHTQKLKWKRKTQSSECKVIDLQNLVSQHEKELQSLRKKILGTPSTSSLQHTELCIKSLWSKLLDLSEEEKHAPLCPLKSQTNSNRRLPLLNIDNISQPLRPIIGAWSPT